MPQKNRFGFTIPDSLQTKINCLPRTVAISPLLVYALDKMADELLKNPDLKPDNFSIRVIEQLDLINKAHEKQVSQIRELMKKATKKKT